MTLPLYKYIETKLKAQQQKFRRPEEASLRMACQKALEKLEVYTDIALDSKYVLLGAVLHPFTRIKYFENVELWDPIVPARARRLLQELYSEYSEKLAAHSKGTEAKPDEQPYESAFGASVAAGRGDSGNTTSGSQSPESEVDRYFRDMFPCKKEHGALEWWKEHADDFPVLSQIARDILAIPGVSIAVERLFSSCRHTLSDTRSSLSAESAAKTVITKEWLKRGLGDDVQYLEHVSIHQ